MEIVCRSKSFVYFALVGLQSYYLNANNAALGLAEKAKLKGT